MVFHIQIYVYIQKCCITSYSVSTFCYKQHKDSFHIFFYQFSRIMLFDLVVVFEM